MTRAIRTDLILSAEIMVIALNEVAGQAFVPRLGILIVVALLLTAAVYSRDEAAARSLLARVNAGSAYWNCCDRVSPRLPWSGRGDSGIGLTLSTYGIQAFTRPKAWHLRQP